MYQVGNVMNVKGEPVQCSVFDSEGNHVRRFYFDAGAKEVYCQNYPCLVEAFGHYQTISFKVPCRTKKEAAAYMQTTEALQAMTAILCSMTGALATLKKLREADRVTKVETEQPTEQPKLACMHKHEIFTNSSETYKKLKESTFCTDAVCWTLNDGSNYYRITLVAAWGEDWIKTGLDLEHLDYDEVITEPVTTNTK